MDERSEAEIARIAKLNDEFRTTTPQVTLTIGVAAIDGLHGLLGRVRRYDTFSEDNDPYGEHDFGVIEWHGQTVYWKVDYYDPTLDHWQDPLSPECHRVLTVLLADEW